MARNHHLSRTPEYGAWLEMKRRCYKTNRPGYQNWGGRGIKVCDRWLNSFLDFYKDMGVRPTANHQLDRIDNNGNYEPDNCRWASRQQQCLNRRQREGYKGVYWSEHLNKWASHIRKRPAKLIHLGVYTDIQEAALAYDCAAIQLFGEDAVLNCPDSFS